MELQSKWQWKDKQKLNFKGEEHMKIVRTLAVLSI